jgi:ATP:ADP antiporter, AAA family
MIGSAAVTAQFIAGKAARDALYLANLDVTTLPMILVVTSLISILFVSASSKVLTRVSPALFVPVGFAVSAVLIVVEWALLNAMPRVAATAFYLHVSGIGPILGSGFWLVSSERFDPRTAKRHYGQIAGAGTLGGIAAGLAAERIGALFGIATMLPVLAAANLFCAWQIRRLAPPAADEEWRIARARSAGSKAAQRSGLQVLKDTPYLRDLAALVLLGTTGAAILDYAFKVQAVSSFGRGDTLLRFFALYYAAVSVVTFVVQASSNRFALEKFGLAVSAGTPSIAMIATTTGAIVAPGLESIVAARAGESVFRGSLFRSAYELFYTPLPPSEKRAAKPLIDVGFDRLGDAVGGALVRVTLMLASGRTAAVLPVAVVCSALTLFVTRRLNRGYIDTLERSLVNRAVELDLSEAEDTTTRTTMIRTLTMSGSSVIPTRMAARAAGTALEDLGVALGEPEPVSDLDEDIQQMLALRSRNRERVLSILRSREPLPGALVPHVIPLLAWDPVAAFAVDALRRVAEEHIGEMTDALIDPNQDFAVRRRMPRVFAVCVSQRAADGLIVALDDLRFEVRYQCARALLAIAQKNPRIRIDKEIIFQFVRREAGVSRPVWESQRLLSQLEDREDRLFVDEFVRDRASRSLAHVFTLLSLVLPTEPLQIAFRGLHTDDANLRGTALEYLEGVLPPSIRDPLWPFLEDNRRGQAKTQRPREEILQDLLRSHQSIVLNLKELQARQSDPDAESKPIAADPPRRSPW